MAGKLTSDDYLELRYLIKRGPTYPKAEPGTDAQLDRLAAMGLIKRSIGFWEITSTGRAALEARDGR